MNVYDFDRTIYARDTTAQFYLWCLARWPRIARRWPAVIRAAFRWRAGRIDKTAFKAVLLAFLRDVPDPAAELERFWDVNMPRVRRWYLAQRRPDDVVVTASPADFVRPACVRLGVERVLGSPVDVRTGVYAGPNCHGEEKARVFREAFPDARPERFYSDSPGDAPMAALARQAFLVSGERLRPWPGTGRSFWAR